MKFKIKSIFIISLIISIILIFIVIYKISLKNSIYTYTQELDENSKFELNQFSAAILANMVQDEKDPEIARIVAEETVEKLPLKEKYKVYFNLANSYYYKNDYKNCIKYLNKAISYNSECYMCYNLRGLTYYALNKNNEAIEDLTKGISIKKDSIMYKHRAIVYNKFLKYRDKSIEDLIQAISLDQNAKDPKILLIDIYLSDSNIFEARKILENMKQYLNLKTPENYVLVQTYEALLNLNENNLKECIKILDHTLNYMLKLKSISLEHNDLNNVYLVIRKIFNKLNFLEENKLVLKYIPKLEKIEAKYPNKSMNFYIYNLKEKLNNN